LGSGFILSLLERINFKNSEGALNSIIALTSLLIDTLLEKEETQTAAREALPQKGHKKINKRQR
jgi:hypothetical protein